MRQSESGEFKKLSVILYSALTMVETNNNCCSRKIESHQVLECGSSLAEREFGHDQEEPESTPSTHTDGGDSLGPDSIDSLRSLIASDVLTEEGLEYTTFSSPFESVQNKGQRQFLSVPMVYCDQTASNRPVKSIEDYIAKVCLPLYGNTHTNTSITGSQSTAFVAEARQIVAEETNAKITGKASLDTVLFAGNGATSAVELLIDCMSLKHGEQFNRPVVFIGPYEHHSNLIPWREAGCDIVMVPECPLRNTLDISALEKLLQKREYADRLKIGTFSAASNVTGKISDVNLIAATLHRNGALAFFDYATAAPYMDINMNPAPTEQYNNPALIAKDAVFLSPHKMLGGIGTPGILIVKKHLVSQVNAPSRSGGGTVFYVTNQHHRFLSNRIERYEGGTPNVCGIIRVGLTFLLKRKAEAKFAAVRDSLLAQGLSIPRSIEEFDYLMYESIRTYLKENAPNLILLGGNDSGTESRNLPIFSFLIRFGNRFLHFNYVCAILNDLFGIQSRGGCQCAGPYSQRLLGLTDTVDGVEVPNLLNEELEHALIHSKERAELLRPGFTRISLPFKGMHPEEVEYVKQALVWVAKNGWALMCQYRCNHRTGEWRHFNRQGKPLGKAERKWLSHYDFTGPLVKLESNTPTDKQKLRTLLPKLLENADSVLELCKVDRSSIAQTLKMHDADEVLGGGFNDAIEKLRWYVYPKECAEILTGARSFFDETGKNDLEGALQPLKVGAPTQSIASDSYSLCNVRKRKSQEEEITSEMSVLQQIPGDKLFFRDGDYSGEASLHEIIAGVDDGELSDQCEIFNKENGEWESYASYNGTGADKKPKVRAEVTVPHVVPRDDIGDVKNEKKKPSRDRNQWGQGTGPTSEAGPRVMLDSPQPDMVGQKNKRHKHTKPPAKMMRLVNQAMNQWEMVKDGDKLLLGLSGGKDSLSLLHCLLEFQRKSPVKFELEVCTIDPMTPSFDPLPLIPYVESLGLTYHYVRDDIVARANNSGKEGKMVSSLCAYCARMKRGNLYSCARTNGCNKLVLAQHLDDCAESFMMSVMHNGNLRTMKANYKIDATDISVIRPMVYCRESLMTDFAKSANLPVINENCPACFEEPKERARVKKLLSREETLYPNFYDNIRRAILPLMHEDSSAILRCFSDEVLARTRKNQNGKRPAGGVLVDDEISTIVNDHKVARLGKPLCEFSDADLLKEIAHRKAEKYKSASHVECDDQEKSIGKDPTGQVCTLDGANGTIRCYELME